jgi:hypothetical protein
MTRAVLTIQDTGGFASPLKDDVAFTEIVAANDLEFDNTSGDVILLVKNAGTSGAQVATVVSVADPEYGRDGDITITAGQGDVCFCGPFLPELYNQSDGKVHIDSANEDHLGFAAIRAKAIRR